ncbi:putative NAD(+) diphosphatase [Dioscorea sansibarensis]
MAILLQAHAFAGNPTRSNRSQSMSPSSAHESLKSLLAGPPSDVSELNFKVLAFKNGKPLATSLDNSPDSPPKWRLGWTPPSNFRDFSADSFVYLGQESETVYWAIDASDDEDKVSKDAGGDGFCFVELRTLMVATDWADAGSMDELAIAGHARGLLEWHNTTRFCGYCGSNTIPNDAGRRKQCTKETCKKKIYPRVDPVVIMLVIDRENDRSLLSRQFRFVPRMWSCLAGFVEPGESLEEAVRRETWEETGIEVGEVVYHSSQPWPVGPSSMPCQLMVGFHAYAKSFDIHVDKRELEDAQWHSRDDVKKALTFAEYEKAQRTAAIKVNQMCKGVERTKSFSSDFNVESGELAPMFIPGPFAIAHHLISSWVYQGNDKPEKHQNFSNL